MKKILISFILICCMLFMLFTECSAMSVSSAKKEYKRFLKFYAGSLSHSDSAASAVYYAFVKFPGKKLPYLLIKDQYNYSICGIELHTIKNGDVNYNGQGFDGQDFYYYKNYVFVESFAGGGCGSIVMYKHKNGKLKKVSGGSKYFDTSDNVQVHKKCMKFAKKKAKKMKLSFSKFKTVKWKEY